jgi:copper chaperone NosL
MSASIHVPESTRATAAAQPIALPARRAVPRVRTTTAVRAIELVLLVVAGGLLLVSTLFPYWGITLHAPQYPKGLRIEAYVYELTGDVSEVDGLNHYIGMMKLNDAAVMERQIARAAIALIAVLAVASFWLRGVWKALARLPIVIYPIVFAADLFGWLYYAGHSLDPHAALSSSIKPFTPRIMGVGHIGQFSTEAAFMTGFVLAVVAAVIVLELSIMQWGTRRAER